MPTFEPSPITCVSCKAECGDGLYDDRAEHYYCDDQCFNDWADANSEVVVEFYARMNVN